MIEIYGKDNCGYCENAKSFCKSKVLPYIYHKLGVDFTREELLDMFPDAKTFPQIKVDGKSIGCYAELRRYYDQVE